MVIRAKLLLAVFALVAVLSLRADAQVTAAMFRSITEREIELLLKDIAVTNPMILKRMEEDPELRIQQIENLKQMLALATQAVNDGLAAEPGNKQELENIRLEVTAVNYDKAINKAKPKLPAFGYIPASRVSTYLADKTHEPEFERFLNAKLTILRADPSVPDRPITAEEKEQARDVFAKTRIYAADYEASRKKGTLPAGLAANVELQVKLQQAQFLSRLAARRLDDKLRASDADIAAYLAAHPELDPAEKRARAEKLLARAKAGEDFAKLANEFTEDPGNQGQDGKLQGGLYRDVPVGQMVKPFETAALALEPGQISPSLVESDFGYHIIKLEKKGTDKDSGRTIYDVRHILVSTGIKDPAAPNGLEVPLMEYVQDQVEKENERKVIDRIVAANNIEVPADFTVPAYKVPTPPTPKPAVKKPRRTRK